MGGPSDTKQEHGGDQQQRPHQHDQRENGRSGHGAASAMAHMISQDRNQRHQIGEADDAAGVTAQ